MCVLFWGTLLGLLLFGRDGVQCVDLDFVDKLIEQWSPLVWLAPGEKYLPLSVEDYLPHVKLATKHGTGFGGKFSQDDLRDAILVPDVALDALLNDSSSFIHGRNPNSRAVSAYAFVKQCPTNIQGGVNDQAHFHVSYWIFYPYNEGKQVCFIGSVPTLKVFDTCLGTSKVLGNHLGDWEHMSISFSKKGVPLQIYLALHDTGVYYTYNEIERNFEFSHQRKSLLRVPQPPQLVKTQGHHPVLFSAHGSHGLWSAPGHFDFVRIPRLTDRNGYGIPWRTWENLKIFHLDRDRLPFWLTYPGKWGNPRHNCFFKGLCEFSQGPVGPLWHPQDFDCTPDKARNIQ